ncbi:MAG: hypothetical protein ACD_62C00385G0001, partial [uncultured bacterium]
STVIFSHDSGADSLSADLRVAVVSLGEAESVSQRIGIGFPADSFHMLAQTYRSIKAEGQSGEAATVLEIFAEQAIQHILPSLQSPERFERYGLPVIDEYFGMFFEDLPAKSEVRALLFVIMSKVHVYRNEMDNAIAAVNAGLEACPDTSIEVRASLNLTLAMIAVRQGNYDCAVTQCEAVRKSLSSNLDRDEFVKVMLQIIDIYRWLFQSSQNSAHQKNGLAHVDEVISALGGFRAYDPTDPQWKMLLNYQRHLKTGKMPQAEGQGVLNE